MEKIISNKIKCKHCGDIIESRYVHEYKSCKCGKVAVDGGRHYLKRSFMSSPESDYIEMSEIEQFPDEEIEQHIPRID